MAMFVLNQSDMNKYADMLELAGLINEIYGKLYELECKEKKDSTEYANLINTLKQLISSESKLYSEKELPSDLCKAYIALTLQVKTPRVFPGNLESISSLNDESICARRMLSKLQKRLINDDGAMIQMMPNDLLEMLNSLGVDDANKLLKQGVLCSTKVQQALEKDTYALFLTLIEDFINQPSLNNLKQTLMRAKYKTAFIIPDIEGSLIDSRFSISPTVWINSRIVADAYRLGDEIYRTLKNLFGIEIANEQLNRLLEITDYDYSNPDRNVEAIFRQSFLRAVLSLIGTDVVENIEDDFKKHTSSVEYTSKITPSRISESLVNEAFKQINHDKSKQIVLSLKPNSQL